MIIIFLFNDILIQNRIVYTLTMSFSYKLTEIYFMKHGYINLSKSAVDNW